MMMMVMNYSHPTTQVRNLMEKFMFKIKKNIKILFYSTRTQINRNYLQTSKSFSLKCFSQTKTFPFFICSVKLASFSLPDKIAPRNKSLHFWCASSYAPAADFSESNHQIPMPLVLLLVAQFTIERFAPGI